MNMGRLLLPFTLHLPSTYPTQQIPKIIQRFWEWLGRRRIAFKRTPRESQMQELVHLMDMGGDKPVTQYEREPIR